MRGLAEEMGVGDTFVPTPVGVYFGAGPGVTAPDPYFGGVGPERTGCLECGECMTGCRHNAKNTLVKNYLGLAERAGAVVHPLTTVTGLRPLPAGRWEVDARPTQSLARSATSAVRRRAARHGTEELRSRPDPPRRSPHSTSSSRRGPMARSSCSTGCGPTASSRSCPTGSGT